MYISAFPACMPVHYMQEVSVDPPGTGLMDSY